jgi:hypothetical protein
LQCIEVSYLFSFIGEDFEVYALYALAKAVLFPVRLEHGAMRSNRNFTWPVIRNGIRLPQEGIFDLLAKNAASLP